jgi:hypothetical protein
LVQVAIVDTEPGLCTFSVRYMTSGSLHAISSSSTGLGLLVNVAVVEIGPRIALFSSASM